MLNQAGGLSGERDFCSLGKTSDHICDKSSPETRGDSQIINNPKGQVLIHQSSG